MNLNTPEIERARQIIQDEGWHRGNGQDPQETLDIINKKYPDEKRFIVMAMVEELVGRNAEEGPAARLAMLKAGTTTAHYLEASNEAYSHIGKHPMIDDISDYPGMSKENSDKLNAEDKALGLQLYNACAEFCRIYNTAKEEMKDN